MLVYKMNICFLLALTLIFAYISIGTYLSINNNSTCECIIEDRNYTNEYSNNIKNGVPTFTIPTLTTIKDKTKFIYFTEFYCEENYLITSIYDSAEGFSDKFKKQQNIKNRLEVLGYILDKKLFDTVNLFISNDSYDSCLQVLEDEFGINIASKVNFIRYMGNFLSYSTIFNETRKYNNLQGYLYIYSHSDIILTEGILKIKYFGDKKVYFFSRTDINDVCHLPFHKFNYTKNNCMTYIRRGSFDVIVFNSEAQIYNLTLPINDYGIENMVGEFFYTRGFELYNLCMHQDVYHYHCDRSRSNEGVQLKNEWKIKDHWIIENESIDPLFK